ncbi:MAG: peptidase S8, partial [Ignavibacteriae bacterium]
TKIKYRIPLSPPLLKGESEAGGFVSLKVYDVLGNEVATLVNENKHAGSYEVEFSAANLANGVYFYKLRVSDFVETKKMILMK